MKTYGLTLLIAAIVLLSVMYGLIVFWVIPTYVPGPQRQLATDYANYGFTILTTIIFGFGYLFQ